MGTTANYSWPTPVATDLVKDGWEAIKDLGDAADTTVKAVSDAQGLVHINTTSIGSGVSAVNIDNVFSSTYLKYKIIYQGIASTNIAINLRLRASGTDNSEALYNRQLLSVGSTSVIASRATNQTSGAIFAGSSTGGWGSADIFRPFQSATTFWQSLQGYNPTAPVVDLITGGHDKTVSYDGITFLAASGTFTSGSFSIYGYKE